MIHDVITVNASMCLSADVPKSIPGRAQLEKDPKKYNLDKIHWIGMANAEDTNTPVLGLAEAMWKGSPVFLKCGTDLSREILAFKMLEVAKSAPNVKDNRDTIMTPLEYFQISRGFLSKNVDCFIYEFVFGMKLEDFVKSQKVVEIAKDLPAILMDIVKGLDYLYRTNLAHNDLHGGNFMVYRDRTTQRPRVKIIDYDRALPLVGDKELATKTGKFVALTESTKLKSDGCRSNNESVYNLLRQLLFNSAGFMDDEQTKYLQKKLQSQGASAQETMIL
ncbi:hypothetical protein BDF19DRAFT_414638 [Syncephalis fuscata]|nr:hypothetical protein BDF19DRAFT_414638 [Syncephalis fuscata]